MPRGENLIHQINACRPPPRGHAAIWWLGQHGFALKIGKVVAYLDPFLSRHPGRKIPPLLEAGEITNADLVFGSHDHLDHIDRPAWPLIAAASPRALFVVPSLLRAKLAKDLKIPLKRLLGLDDGKSRRARGLKISGIASAHEFLDRDPVSGRYPYLGFVVQGWGLSLYHCGDCCLYEGLLSKVRRFHPDVVFLPINGRDARRLKAGCIGNLTFQEAADFAGSLRPRLALPAHFDMFEGNTEDPRKFTEYLKIKYPGLKTRVLSHGRRQIIP